MDYLNFKDKINFINAEWGVEVDIIKDEAQFKKIMEANSKNPRIGSACITFKDVLNLVHLKFRVNNDDKKMIRFIDCPGNDTQLKIITKSDLVIFKRG